MAQGKKPGGELVGQWVLIEYEDGESSSDDEFEGGEMSRRHGGKVVKSWYRGACSPPCAPRAAAVQLLVRGDRIAAALSLVFSAVYAKCP